MLNIHNLSLSFQGTYLFEDVTFKINRGDRIGLIGKNGAGKSTILKILSRELTPDSGEIAQNKDIRIGFLKQDIDFDLGKTVLEEAYTAFEVIQNLERQIEILNKEMSERRDYDSESYNQLIIDANDIQEQYMLLGGYSYQGHTEKILQGLGFKRTDFDKPTDSFSGGWRMRIELAKLLLQDNDILLLDEPTNHLDIESIIWLEGFLKQFSGAVIVVSHDKMFLDNITNRTIEISMGRIYDYPKPYSKYLLLRKELRIQQLASQKNQQKQIQQTEKLIEKFRAKASKASMAQSLIKKLDKIERIEVDEEDHSVMKLRFPVSITPGKIIIEAENISKEYGNNHVLENINLFIERQQKIAFVGQNGQGKSTLAKIIVGDINSSNGTLKLGHNVHLGYFAQNQAESLDGNKTILDTMIDAANETNRSKVRDILGAFLFKDDTVEKYVRVLSGGERNRLALAKLMLEPFNVLVMDEPTNHLDIKSKHVLKEALKLFEGTLILVSHDRDFLQDLTDIIYEFKDKKIKPFLGDIDYYLEQRNVENLREIEKQTVKIEPKKSSKNTYGNQKKIKSLKNKLSHIELKIQELENNIKRIDVELQINYDKMISDPNFFGNYEKMKADLDEALEKWETIQLEIEKYS